MNCPNCGAEIQNGAKFCEYCGTKVQNTQEEVTKDTEQSTYNPFATQNPSEEPKEQVQEQQEDPQKPQFKMGWHKFLIYFALWFGCIFNCLDGVSCVSLTSESVRYLIIGILEIAIGVFQICARFSLANYKKNGPILLHTAYSCLILLDLIMLYFTAGTVRTYYTSLIASIVILIINITYYNHRKSLFTRV